MSNLEIFSLFPTSPIQAGQYCTKMPNSVRRFIAALLCIFAELSSFASASQDINVSQPKESDVLGVNAYDSAILHNDSNQIV